MNIPQPRTALWRATAFVLLLGSIVGAGLWWSQHDEPEAGAPTSGLPATQSDPADARSDPARPLAPVILTLREGELGAPEVARQYQSDRHAANARYQGQRLTVRGQVQQIERGQDDALLVTYVAEDDASPLRALLQTRAAPEPQVGEVLGLNCLNQGLVMEEPLLIDCHVQH